MRTIRYPIQLSLVVQALLLSVLLCACPIQVMTPGSSACESEGTCVASCGSGTREPTEDCEGTDLGGATCSSLGYPGGTLSCDNSCTFNTSACGSCPAHVSTSRGTLGSAWTVAGPPGGNITSLLALGNDVVLAGTGSTRGRAGAQPMGNASAIYRSIDGGVNFTLSQRFIDSLGNTVHRFARVGSTNRIYAAVSGDSDATSNGIWMSDNAGVSWSDVSTGLHNKARPVWVAAAPGTPERIYAMIRGSAASPGGAIHNLYRRDDGAAWVRMSTTGVDQLTGGPALALGVHPSERNTVFLANSDRFFTSTDGGDTFSALVLDTSLFTGASNTDSLFVDPNNGDHIVLTTRFEEMIESLDGGLNWTRTNISAYGQHGVAFIAGNTYVATTSDGLQFSDGGDFEKRGACMREPSPTAVSVAPDNENQVFVGFDGQGVLHSSDASFVFTPQASGIDDLVATVAVTGPSDAPTAWIMSGAGLFRSTDGGAEWTRIVDGFGTLAFNSITADPNNPDHVLAGTNGDWYAGGGYSQGVFDINLADGTVRKATGFAGGAPAMNGLAFDPTNAQVVYAYQDTGSFGDATTVPTTMYRSTDGGLSFSSTGITGNSFLGNIACSTSQMFMASSGQPYFCVLSSTQERTVEIYTTTNEGQTFDIVWSGESSSLGNRRMYFPYSGIFVDGSENLYFTSAGSAGLAQSTDGGLSVDDFGAGLSDFAQLTYHLTFAPNGGILLATYDGAYYAADGSAFVELNEGFESFSRGPRGRSVAVIPGSPNIALISTAQGVFRRILP